MGKYYEASKNTEKVGATIDYAAQLKEYQDQIATLRLELSNHRISGAERQEVRDQITIIKKKILDLPAGEVTTNIVNSTTIADKVYSTNFRLKADHYRI